MLDGAARTCVTVDGSLLSERILSVDHATRTFRYAIDDHPLPAARMEAAIAVTDLGAASCRVEWSARYEVAEVEAAFLNATLESLYSQGIRSLEAHCRAAA